MFISSLLVFCVTGNPPVRIAFVREAEVEPALSISLAADAKKHILINRVLISANRLRLPIPPLPEKSRKSSAKQLAAIGHLRTRRKPLPSR